MDDRTNIVLSSSFEKDGRSGFFVVSNLDELKTALSGINKDRIYVIGEYSHQRALAFST